MDDEEKHTSDSGSRSLSPDIEKHEGTPDDAHSEIEKLDSGHQMDLALSRHQQEVRQFITLKKLHIIKLT